MHDLPTLNEDHGWDRWDWNALRTSCLREARRLLDSEDDAEEAAQNALLRAWRGRARQRQRGAEGPWIRQIARNEALRLIARQARRRDLLAEVSDELMAEVACDQGASADPEILDLREAIAELSPRDALLLRLRYEGDFTQPRLARIAGMPEGTVKIRLHRIRGRLRERLTGEHD